MITSDIDLHLLQCLDALVAERHVTRAAERMGMSQSGMSAALARLRTVFDDPILVRTPQGMQLSQHADEIVGAVRRAIHEIELAVARRGPFDAASSSVTFSMMASDYIGLMLLPGLVERLRREAPRIGLKVFTPEPSRIREALANGEVDLVVGFFHDISEGLYQTVMANESLSCVVRRGHPAIDGRIGIAQYSAGEHLFYGSPPAMVSSIEVLLERTLAQLGVERRIAVYIPTLAVMPRVIAQSDVIGTLPTGLALSFAERLPLQVLPLPFETPPLPVRVIWHERLHENNAHRWLRGVVADIGRDL